jgi:glycosyltransferase involved in cell wall biosynthesis
MAHIGIDCRLKAYRKGGISTYATALVQALGSLDSPHHYTIFYSYKDSHIPVHRFGSARLRTPPHHRLERWALGVETALHNLDLLHCPDFIPPHFGAKRMVITVHDLTFLHFPQHLTAASRRYYTGQIRDAVNRADHILTVSDSAKRDLISMLDVSSAKITVQPNGVSPAFRPLAPEDTQETLNRIGLPSTYLLHVGTFEPRKNLVTLVRAYKILRQTLPDAPPILFVGQRGWLYDDMMREIHAVGVGDHLIWNDTISDDLLPAVYNRASLLVMPSHYEGFGLPPLEAMACGTIPIVSNRASLPEVVGDVGAQFDPDNPAELAHWLHYALTNSAWRDDMRQRCLARAAHFTWERSARIALSVYHSLV